MSDKPYFGMFTDEGNKAVANHLDCLQEDLTLAAEALREAVSHITKEHPEFTDTAVRERICYELTEIVLCLADNLTWAVQVDSDAFLTSLVQHIWSDTDSDEDDPLIFEGPE